MKKRQRFRMRKRKRKRKKESEREREQERKRKREREREIEVKKREDKVAQKVLLPVPLFQHFLQQVCVRKKSGKWDHRHLSLKVQNVEFNFDVKFSTLMYPGQQYIETLRQILKCTLL